MCHSHRIIIRDLTWVIPGWSSGFPYFLLFKSEFCNKEFMIWATVSSWSCFCWLYRASPPLAAKNIINLISALTIWWCPCVGSSLVLLEEGVCYDQCVLFAKLSESLPCFILFSLPSSKAASTFLVVCYINTLLLLTICQLSLYYNNKLPYIEWLKQTFFSHSSGGWKSKISVLKLYGFWWGVSTRLQTVDSCILTWRKERKLAHWPLFLKALLPFLRIQPSWPVDLPKVLSPNSITLGIKFQYEHSGDTNIHK